MIYKGDVNMKTISIVLLAIAAVVVLLGYIWIAQGNDFFMYKVFAPKYAKVQRQVFEQTPSFNKGMVQELENMRFDYMKEKDPKAKDALGSIILHRASGYNLNDPDVPADLRQFIGDLKVKQLAEKY
jgi:hypothetical protein